MKAKRKTMLVAALAVAVIALAGLGYAAGYTATTKTTGNKEVPEYAIISLDDDNNSGTATTIYDGKQIKLEYNTKTSSAGTQYQLKEETTTFTIYIDATAVNATSNNYTLTITGLSVPNIVGATAAWSVSGGSAISETSTTITGDIDVIKAAYLTLTITRTSAGEGWTVAGNAPAAEVDIGGNDGIAFSLVNNPASP